MKNSDIAQTVRELNENDTHHLVGWIAKTIELHPNDTLEHSIKEFLEIATNKCQEK